jgi:hypothetical protein
MTVTTEEKYKALLDALWMRTATGKVQWEDTSEDDAFSTKLPPYIVRLFPSETEDQLDYVIQIYDANGNLVDYFNDVNLKRLKPADLRFTSYFSLMKEMHRRAGRYVSGAEKALDNILSSLGIEAEEASPQADDLPF